MQPTVHLFLNMWNTSRKQFNDTTIFFKISSTDTDSTRHFFSTISHIKRCFNKSGSQLSLEYCRRYFNIGRISSLFKHHSQCWNCVILEYNFIQGNPWKYLQNVFNFALRTPYKYSEYFWDPYTNTSEWTANRGHNEIEILIL